MNLLSRAAIIRRICLCKRCQGYICGFVEIFITLPYSLHF